MLSSSHFPCWPCMIKYCSDLFSRFCLKGWCDLLCCQPITLINFFLSWRKVRCKQLRFPFEIKKDWLIIFKIEFTKFSLACGFEHLFKKYSCFKLCMFIRDVKDISLSYRSEFYRKGCCLPLEIWDIYYVILGDQPPMAAYLVILVLNVTGSQVHITSHLLFFNIFIVIRALPFIINEKFAFLKKDVILFKKM